MRAGIFTDTIQAGQGILASKAGNVWTISTDPSGLGPITEVNGSADVTVTAIGGARTLTLTDTGIVAGSYGDATHIPQLTVDAKGRTVGIGTVPFSGGSTVAGTAPVTVSNVGSAYTVALANSGVTADTYGDATNVPQLTVDAKGRVTAATTLPVSVSNITDTMVSASAGIKATKLAYDSTGTGAVTRTVAQIITDYENSVKRYNAALDGITDDTSAINNAITALQGKEIFIPPGGNAKVTGALTALTDKTTFKSHAGKALISPAGNFNLFTLNGNDISIADLYIDDTNKTGGYDITVACGTGPRERVYVDRVYTLKSRGFMQDSGSGSSAFYYLVYFRDCLHHQHMGPGYTIRRAFGFTYFDDCVVDFVGSSSANSPGWDVNAAALAGNAAAGGIEWTRCNVLAGFSGANTSQHGWTCTGVSEVHFTGCGADGLGGSAFNLDTCAGVYLNAPWAHHINLHCYNLTSCTKVIANSVHALGRNVFTTNDGAATQHGIYVNSCSNVDISGGLTEAFTGDGFRHTASTLIRVSNLASNANTNRGINCTSTGALNWIGGMTIANVAGNYTLQNSTQGIAFCQLDSGGFQTTTGGPVSG